MDATTSPVVPRTAVCVVRAEPQGETLLFSVTGNTDVEHRSATHLYGHASDVAGTMLLVHRFLQDVDDLRALDNDR